MNRCMTKQFQLLSDVGMAWELMTDVFTPDGQNGPFAPYFEYAISSSWLNKDYLHLNRFWLDGDRPVAFVFYEQPASCLHFVLRPGYEALADEMIAYAESGFPDFGEPKELELHEGQRALIRAAEKRGWRPAREEPCRIFDFSLGRLEYPLPEGYHFIDVRKADPLKVARCLWEGFNSEELGPFEHWDEPTRNGGWSPYELYHDVVKATISPPPHATYADQAIIADARERYVCFSGMWWVEKNRLAYMEPLCTVPDCRGKGLAAAALSDHDRRLRPRGAVIMTGGGNPFYEKIGFQREIRSLYFRKDLVDIMKRKSVGPGLSLCVQPAFIIGTVNEDGSGNFAPITWVSVTCPGGNDYQLVVSMFGSKVTKQNVKRTGLLSANLVSEDMLPLMDYLGTHSAKNGKKDGMPYSVSRGETLDVPVLDDSPWVYECEVSQAVETGESTTFFCRIRNIQIDDRLNVPDPFHIDLTRLNPVVYSGMYHSIGKLLGQIGDFSPRDGQS